jgi:hypothetical protein
VHLRSCSCRNRSGKLTVTQLVKNLPVFCRNRRFVAVFIAALHSALSSARWIQPTSFQPNYVRLNLLSYRATSFSSLQVLQQILYAFVISHMRATCCTFLFSLVRSSLQNLVRSKSYGALHAVFSRLFHFIILRCKRPSFTPIQNHLLIQLLLLQSSSYCTLRCITFAFGEPSLNLSVRQCRPDNCAPSNNESL